MKYLIALSLIFTVSSASTQETMPQPNNMKTFITRQPCDTWERMLSTPAKYKEEMLFTGNAMQFSAATGQPYTGGMFFFTNQNTGSWTMLMVYGDGIACMVANGKQFAPYSGKQPNFNEDDL